MTIIKKIKLSSVEKGLEGVVLLCSKIKAYQDEIMRLDEELEDNRKELSEGLLSKKIYFFNKKSTSREKRKNSRRMNVCVKKALKKIDDLETFFKQIEI